MHDQTFERELLETIVSCTKRAQRNYVYAHIIFIVSVLGSFFASILAATNFSNPALTAALAALPGLMLLINNTLRFEERTRWFWKKVRMTECFYRKLRDASNPAIDPLSARYSDEAARLEMEWPAFGNTPGQPKKGGID